MPPVHIIIKIWICISVLTFFAPFWKRDEPGTSVGPCSEEVEVTELEYFFSRVMGSILFPITLSIWFAEWF